MQTYAEKIASLGADAVEEWEERAAIIQFCARYGKEAAEREAYEQIVAKIKGPQQREFFDGKGQSEGKKKP